MDTTPGGRTRMMIAVVSRLFSWMLDLLLSNNITALHTILNGHALLTTMGVLIFFLWREKCFKKCRF